MLVSMGYVRLCNTARACEDEIIDCPPGELCNVQCTGTPFACASIVVNCPADYLCNIQCNGSTGACNQAILNCNSGSCSIDCLGNTQPCAYATINGNAANYFAVRCENLASCFSAKIYCPTGSDCNIPCRGKYACQNTEIYGASNRALDMLCNDDFACDSILVDARSSSELIIGDCVTGESTCRGITVYCPPNVLGDRKCTINGDDGLYGNNEYPLSFYAINGFADINFIVNGKSSDYTGTMYCEPNYQSQCDISFTGFECDPSENTLCNVGNTDATTNEPTNSPISPSISPSYSPITPIPTTPSPTSQPSRYPTNQPSNQPSLNPTTSAPTFQPSLAPTDQPSFQPSIIITTSNPTQDPSAQPSYSPSNTITTTASSTTFKITLPSNTETSTSIPDASTTANQTRTPMGPSSTQTSSSSSPATPYNETLPAALDNKSTTVGNILQIPETVITSTESISSTKSTLKDVNAFVPPSNIQQNISVIEYAVIGGSSLIFCGCCVGIIFSLLRRRSRESALRSAFGEKEKEKQVQIPSKLENIHSNSVKSISVFKSNDTSMKVYGRDTNQSMIVNITTRGNDYKTWTRGYIKDSGSEQHSIGTLRHATSNTIHGKSEGVIVPRKDQVALPQTLNGNTISGKTSIGTDFGDV